MISVELREMRARNRHPAVFTKLEVLTTNARAIRFYEKEGFAIASTDEFAGRKTYIMKRA